MSELASLDAYNEQKARIESAVVQAFVTAGDALRVIRDGKLYKAAGFNTFEDCIRAEWQMTRDMAYKLIAASEAVSVLDVDRGIQILPSNERVARELTPLLPVPDTMCEAWREAVDTAEALDGTPLITAKHVKAVVGRYKPIDAEFAVAEEGCTVEDLHTLVRQGAKFGTVYADPPWAYSNQATRASTDNHYETVEPSWLCIPENMPVADLAADEAHLHLWTTNAFLFEAEKVIEAWGFEYKSCFVWVKPQMGIGNYWRVSHEFMLLGVRGGLTFADKGLMSWAQMDRAKHSSKPHAVREMIESASPPNRLELFGREAIHGWHVWGNEVSREHLWGDGIPSV